MLHVFHPSCETPADEEFRRERDPAQTPWPRQSPRTLRSHPYELSRPLLGAFGQKLPTKDEWRFARDDDAKEARSLRYRRSPSLNLREAREPAAVVDVNALASADTALLLAVTNNQGGRVKVASAYNRAFVMFESELKWPIRCSLCGDLFNNELVGTLPCAYHPFFYINRSVDTAGYTIAQPPPTPCLQCSEQHLIPSIRCNLVAENLRYGCTPVDHTTDIRELLSRPFIAVPAIFWELLVLSKKLEYSDLDVLVRQPDVHRGIVLVHSPEQLTRVLVMDIPGTKHEFRIAVATAYERMAKKFGIQSLADAVYNARAGTAQSSISKMAQFTHPDAERRDSLRRLQRKQARFAPFILLARISQRGGGGMRLE